jgi:nicotinamidase-related amidase
MEPGAPRRGFRAMGSPSKNTKLRGGLTARSVHLCIDMQRLFAPGGPWPTAWLVRTLPRIAAVAAARPAQTVFTRFIPPVDPDDLPGTWRGYYERWRNVTLRHLDPAFLAVLPELTSAAPAAPQFDKAGYSAFTAAGLEDHLRQREADAIVVTGAETDVCVLATVLGAVDRGIRVVVVSDAVCSSSDEGHDALVDLFTRRYSEQVEVADTATVLAAWA